MTRNPFHLLQCLKRTWGTSTSSSELSVSQPSSFASSTSAEKSPSKTTGNCPLDKKTEETAGQAKEGEPEVVEGEDTSRTEVLHDDMEVSSEEENDIKKTVLNSNEIDKGPCQPVFWNI